MMVEVDVGEREKVVKVGGQARSEIHSNTPLPKHEDSEIDKLSQYDNASV